MTQRDRMVLAVVVAIAALGAFWFLVLGPKREEASKLSDKVSTEQKRLQDAQQTVAAGQAAKQAYPRNYATVARLGEAVPVEDQVPSLVVQVNAAARSTGVDFRALKLSGGTGGPQARRYSRRWLLRSGPVQPSTVLAMVSPPCGRVRHSSVPSFR